MSYGDSTGARGAGKAPVVALLLDTREGFWNEVAPFKATVYAAVTTQPPLAPSAPLEGGPGAYYLVLSAQVATRQIRYFVEALPGLSILDAQAQPEETGAAIETYLREAQAQGAARELTVRRGRWEVLGG